VDFIGAEPPVSNIWKSVRIKSANFERQRPLGNFAVRNENSAEGKSNEGQIPQTAGGGWF
jgi:hypothetical protein